MMIRDDLKNAAESVLELMVEQGEKRLSAQCDFADAQDERGTAIVNAAAALAAAAVALGGGSFATLGKTAPLTVGALVAMLGFTAAACVGLWALRSAGFHSCGFYPSDFVEDVQAGKSVRDLKEDFALDLQIRLTANKGVLDKRGQITNAATLALIATPILAAIAAYLVA